MPYPRKIPKEIILSDFDQRSTDELIEMFSLGHRPISEYQALAVDEDFDEPEEGIINGRKYSQSD